MCLLDRVEAWDATAIRCTSLAHRDPDNPLRRHGRLAGICTVEFGLQAMAAHGALTAGGPQQPGLVTSLRDVVIAMPFADHLPDALRIEATVLAAERRGYIYRFRVESGDRPVSYGQAVIVIPDPGA